MKISELISLLEELKEKKGDLPVYMDSNGFYYSIESIKPDIVVNPDAKKGEGKLSELIVLCNYEKA